MSGIAGIIHFDRMPAQAGGVQRMIDAMAHRAVDGRGLWLDGPAALGHALLQTSVSSAGLQPLCDAESGVVLSFDGRIDNPAELAHELRSRGEMLQSASDSELVLRAYHAWGRDLVDHLDGDFAFAIWDARTGTLTCARDRTGNRPFHYHWSGTTLTFASDASALLALPWVDRQLNLDFIAESIAMDWTSVADTYWQGIRRLPPAHRLEARDGRIRTDGYWQPRLDQSLPCRGRAEFAEYYRELLFDIVRRMSRSSGPVACEVSGGLDSSAIFAVAVDLRRRGLWLAPDVEGYTLDFLGAGDADEMSYVTAVADHVGVSVTRVPPTRKPLAWYEDWTRREGYPAGYPNGVMGLGIREQATRRGCKALLVGVGGDEWLDGERPGFAELVALRGWSELRSQFREEIRSNGLAHTAWHLARTELPPLLPARFLASIRNLRRHRAWRKAGLQRGLRRRLLQRKQRPDGREPSFTRIGQRAQLRQLAGAYSLLARESEERLGAWAGLELRRPFWDARMVQFAFSTPEHVRREGWTTKATHRLAMAGLLPEAVLERMTKADFMVTFGWSKDEIRAWLSDAAPVVDDWLTSEGIHQLLRDYGDPRLAGAPDWCAWSLFHCYTVAQCLEPSSRDSSERTQA